MRTLVGGVVRIALHRQQLDIYFLHPPTCLHRTIATTQFEATDARRAFPCFDEPAFKAQFEVSILKPAGYHALGNMPAINSPLQSTKAVVYFMPTPIMSTYLVAFILCDFANKESTTREGVKVRVWGPAAAVADGQADFALSVATETISYYGSLFNIPYPLPKVRPFDGDRNSHKQLSSQLTPGRASGGSCGHSRLCRRGDGKLWVCGWRRRCASGVLRALTPTRSFPDSSRTGKRPSSTARRFRRSPTSRFVPLKGVWHIAAMFADF